MFVTLTEACLQTVVELLEKQYDKYFKCNLTEELAAETKSARTHNIDAEEIMGMFSALKAKSPNVFICYISCKMRAKKNGTVKYLEAMDKVNREAILKKAVKFGQKQRKKRRVQQEDVRQELMRRDTAKQQKKDLAERRKVGKKLKKIEPKIEKLQEEFPEVG